MRRKSRASASARRRRRTGVGRRDGIMRAASAKRDLGKTNRGGGGDTSADAGKMRGDGRGLRGGLPRSHMWPAAGGRASCAGMGQRAAEDRSETGRRRLGQGVG
jgi:hypothetical protein